jgi:uncharacterized protein
MPDFEWDPDKAESNLKKHGVPFEYATRVFLDPARLDREDTRKDYGEERRITTGVTEGRVFIVAYTHRRRVIRQPVIRLISARKANVRETKQYQTLSA